MIITSKYIPEIKTKNIINSNLNNINNINNNNIFDTEKKNFWRNDSL